MFGYIRPHICDLKVCEYELYQAYYCGLCKALKSEYGRSSILNYDCAFIYILGDSLRETDAVVEPCSCFLHPIKKKKAVISDSAPYAAAVNMLMGYAKAQDDAMDGGKLVKRLAPMFYRKPYVKAAAALGNLNNNMLSMAEELRALERANSPDTDAVADTYARLFGEALTDLDVLQSHILYELGYSIGRWVYLIDAFDDIGEDLKSGNYNVFISKYGISGEIPEQARREAGFGFNYTLSQAMNALKRLELKKNSGILQNIICFGLKAKTREVVNKHTTEEITG